MKVDTNIPASLNQVAKRIADASVMPGVTTGNTMAPCVIIGEGAVEILKADHKL